MSDEGVQAKKDGRLDESPRYVSIFLFSHNIMRKWEILIKMSEPTFSWYSLNGF